MERQRLTTAAKWGDLGNVKKLADVRLGVASSIQNFMNPMESVRGSEKGGEIHRFSPSQLPMGFVLFHE
jgi:hypothetical protein